MITTEHNGITITYNEPMNIWEFELRGRSRTAESLAKAKEAIDKPPKNKAEAKTFKRCEAFAFSFGEVKRITVTSIADEDSWNGAQCWVIQDGRRSRQPVHSTYAITPENEARVKEFISTTEKIKALRSKTEQIKQAMTPIEV